MAMANAFSAVLFACQTLIDQAESLSLLAAERAALGQAGDTTGGLGEDVSAAGAHNNSLGVGEDSGDLDAALLYEKYKIYNMTVGQKEMSLASYCWWGSPY